MNDLLYKGEELIDVEKIDLNNDEVVNAIKTTINKMFDDGAKCLDSRIQETINAIKKIDDAMQRYNVKLLERKKSIFSNILYVIGSAISPELVPLDLYGKQEMPESKKKEYNELKKQADEHRKALSDALPIINEYKIFHNNLKNEILNSNEQLLRFLSGAIESYKTSRTTGQYADATFFLGALKYANYITLEDVGRYCENGVAFFGATMKEDFIKLNEWYVKTIGNETKTK